MSAAARAAPGAALVRASCARRGDCRVGREATCCILWVGFTPSRHSTTHRVPVTSRAPWLRSVPDDLVQVLLPQAGTQGIDGLPRISDTGCHLPNR